MNYRDRHSNHIRAREVDVEKFLNYSNFKWQNGASSALAAMLHLNRMSSVCYGNIEMRRMH